MFIPEWGTWLGVVFVVLLTAAVSLLKKEAETLEKQADTIEEVYEARRKEREM